MCGIFLFLEPSDGKTSPLVETASKEVQCRGMDSSVHSVDTIVGYRKTRTLHTSFYRHEMNGLSSTGAQPFIMSGDKRLVKVFVNGEIYNHLELRELFSVCVALESKSDCAVVLPLYLSFGMEETLRLIKGEFSIVIVDINTKNSSESKIICARDQFGKKALSYCIDGEKLGISQEEMSLVSLFPGKKIINLPPRYIMTIPLFDETVCLLSPDDIFNKKDVVNTLQPRFYKYFDLEKEIESNRYFFPKSIPSLCSSKEGKDLLSPRLSTLQYELHQIHREIRRLFTKCVGDRMKADVDIGTFNSGGLDSSLCTSIGLRFHKGLHPTKAFYNFTIGMSDSSSDMRASKRVSDFCKTIFPNVIHVPIIITPEEGFECIPDVIKTLASYDTTTIRATVGQYMMARYIRREYPHLKGFLTGEGADEVEWGYEPFKYAKTLKECDQWSKFLVDQLYDTDCKRVDKAVSCHNLEAREPFLDTSFVLFYMSLPLEFRSSSGGKTEEQLAKCKYGKIEKRLIRDAFSFESSGEHYLPPDILYRKKETFSSGISPGEDAKIDEKEIKSKEPSESKEMRSKNWYKIIQEMVEHMYTNEELEIAKVEYKHLPPTSKETLHYRKIHESYFGCCNEELTRYLWLPPKRWIDTSEPDARSLSTYKSTSVV